MRRRCESSCRSWVPPFVLGAMALLCAPKSVGATICGTPVRQGIGALTVTEDVPVDAHLWRYFHCGFEPQPCTLEHGGFVGMTAFVRHGSNCDDEQDDQIGFGELVEYVPQQPLGAGQTYTLKCPITSVWGDVEEQTFTVRASDAPSAGPEDVELREIRIKRGEEGCCAVGDQLVVALDGLDAPYLREGGRIELLYSTGEVFPIGTDAESELLLPLPEGPIELTPVAANGVRGEVLRIEPEDIGEREAVYIPCAVGQRHFGAALWLFVPLLWIAGRRRRRA